MKYDHTPTEAASMARAVISIVWKANEVGTELEFCGPFCGCQSPVVQRSSVLAVDVLPERLGHRITECIYQWRNSQIFDKDFTCFLFYIFSVLFDSNRTYVNMEFTCFSIPTALTRIRPRFLTDSNAFM